MQMPYTLYYGIPQYCSTLQYTPHAVTVHTYNGGTSATHALSTRSLVSLQVMVAEPTWIWEAEGSEWDPLTLGAG